ncbi:MAG: hypothetical protein ACOC2L_00970, partial [Candidatus Sumerlaeota bacterium]
MIYESAKNILAKLRNRASTLAIVVLACWFAFFVALLAGSRNDGVTPPPPGGLESEGTAPGASLSPE